MSQMSTADFLSKLRALDVVLSVHGDRLRCNAPAGVMTPELRNELAERKAALLKLLQDAPVETWSASTGIPHVPREGKLPLSFAQQRLWFMGQMEGASEAYHMPLRLHLKGFLNRAVLRKALDRILARHEVLRTTFSIIDGEPLQKIAAAEDSHFLIIERDLRQEENAQAELDRLCEFEAGACFDFEAGPLIRGRLIQLGDDEHVLLITTHHIVSDGWSETLMIKELGALYAAFLRGQDDPLPKFDIQYADYSVWQRQWVEGDLLKQQADYWKTALAGAPAVLEIPADHPRPAVQNYSGAFEELALDGQLTAGLKEFSRRHRVTLFMTLMAAWAALLARLSGQQDVVIGTPVANREQKEIEELIGFFVNTLAVRLDLSGSPSVGELLERTKAQVRAAMQHQDIPFERVVEVTHPVRSLSHSPLLQVMFAWQNTERGTLELPGIEARIQPTQRRKAKFDLLLDLQENGGTISGGIEYATMLFEQQTIQRYVGYFRTLLQAMVADDSAVIDRLPILPESDRHQLLYNFNAGKTNFRNDKCVHRMFEEQVARTPNAVALSFEDATLSYAELNRRSNQLAHYLRELGVKPDTRVAICVQRSFEMVVALMAVLKAGAAYVPFDPAYPAERLHFMLEDSAPVALLLQDEFRGLFAGAENGVPVIDLANAALWRSFPETNPDPKSLGLASQHLAYVIYTSGSTGNPKGVLVEHRNVVRLMAATDAWFHFDEHDVWTLFHSYAFDFSVWELWGAFFYGGRLVVVPRDIARSAGDFYKLLCREKVTVLNQTPSAFRQLIEAQGTNSDSHCLRYVVFGGEALEVTTLKPWYEQNRGRQTQLINMYGITETTVHVTYRPLREADTLRYGSSPIGCAIPDLTIYILDAYGQPVPIGVTGELYVGGAGVARGYLNRPELTAERFLTDPFGSEPGARIYRTGDLGRWLADGSIEYLGRNDFQIKIRGFRIELGEIEARLAECPGVCEAVVIVREDTPGDKRLVAYYRTSDARDSSEGTTGVEQLRSFLLMSLPDYMVPAAYVHLDSLPLTPNGKLDRKALPPPDANAFSVRGYEAPQGEVEEKLAEIFSEVLGINQVGRHDNFFELGGHSLLATLVISRCRRALGLDVPLRSIFDNQTLAEFAEYVAAIRSAQPVAGSRSPAISPAPRDGELPLSFAQTRLWLLDRLEPGSSTYNIPSCFRLKGKLELSALEQSLTEIVRRHEVLRACYLMVDGKPVQEVRPPEAFKVPVVDLRGLAVADKEEESARLAQMDARQPFDLSQAPLMRATLLRLASEEYLLLLSIHHIAIDGWSFGVFARELSTLYRAFLHDEASPLPELPIQYADFAVWQRQWLQGEVLQTQLDYWREKLKGSLPVLELPTDHARPALQTYNGATVSRMLSRELTERLRALSRQEGVTLFVPLLAALQVLLLRYTGQEDILVGTAIANRNQAEIEELIGLFANTLVMRADLSGDPSFRELLRQVEETALGAYAHQDLPFERLVEALNPERDMSRSPIFQVMLLLENTPMQPLELSGLELSRLNTDSGTSKFDLSLYVFENPEGLSCTFEYNTDLFDSDRIERMAGHLRVLLESIVRDPGRHLSELPLLTDSERRRLLVGWNDTSADYPKDVPLAQLVENQVERTPNAIAVVAGEQRVTYRQLNARANQLARALREHGAGPDQVVGVYVDRSTDLVVALLAIVKTGAAYLPLDPLFPAERLGYMLEDSGARLLVSERTLSRDLSAFAGTTILLEDEGWHANRSDNLAIPVGSEHLAYLIYTSGSTGKPKGVQVGRGALTNLLWSMREQLQLSERDRLLAVTTISFDIAGVDMWLPLLVGAQMVVASREQAADGHALRDLLERHDITFLQATPVTWQLLFEAGWQGKPNLQAVCTGEAMPPEVAARLAPAVERVWNLYGPTETTIWSTGFRVTDGTPPIPIGRPVANTQIYILDSQRQPVPIGIAGELYIGGDGLARGYLNRPELTAEKFVPDPFRGGEARMYRTGDLARYRADGNIECLGRMDHQVKIRGFRIELGEIEETLKALPEIRQAVVIAREDTPGKKRLVAYYTTRKDGDSAGDAVSTEQLRTHLSATLPDYMVPAAYVRLDGLPLTPNGKLDRKALPPPVANAFSVRGYEAPQGDVETKLAEIFSDVLGINQVGRHDNFFELGGHSLLATLVISRCRRALGLDVPLRSIFDNQTLAEFAEYVAAIRSAQPVAGSRSPAISPAPRDGELPLSFAQTRLWLLDRLEPGSSTYNIPSCFRLKGKLELSALEQSLTEIVRRHEVLRACYLMVDGKPVQELRPPEAFKVPVVDLRGLGVADKEEESARLAQMDARQPFDLSQAPLMRATLLRLASEEYLLLLSIHHIAIDGWSFGVFARELSTLYRAFLHDEASPLPELPIQYADFAVWQRQWLQGEVLQTQLDYWREKLKGSLPVLELPTDHARPALQTYNGATVSRMLSRELTERLRALSRQEGVTLFVPLLAALQVLLLRYTGQEDILVGTAIANRNQAEIEELIGLFANTLVMRADLSGDPSFRELLRQVEETALGAYAHQDLPFERLVEALNPERDMSRSPIFQVMLLLENTPMQPLELSGLELSRLNTDSGTSKFDLSLYVFENPEGLSCTFEYNTDLFDSDRIERMAGHLRVLLESIVRDPGRHLSELPLLTDSERRRLLVGWNDTAADYPKDDPLAQLVENQVERTPNAIAVVAGEQRVTYRQLNARANQLARALREHGAGPDQVVGVYVDRSTDLVVALLAIVKTGAAYLPLDPLFPAERLTYMLEDSGARLLVSERTLSRDLPAFAGTTILLEDEGWHANRSDNLAIPVGSEHLAYLIYTSGSTGKPKGVQVGRGALTNFLWSMREQLQLSERDRLLAVTTISFDIAGLEVWLPLLVGAQMVVASREQAADGHALRDLLERHDITFLQATPVTWQLLFEAGWQGKPNLQAVCGGEAMPPEVAARLALAVERVWNLYGPTETTIWSTGFRVTDGTPPIPIGRPVANTQIYILDSQRQPVPIGIAGELYIGGDGLARGYLNRPELTAEKFVPDPFRGGEARMYRTGDLARYRADGNIECLGRIDHQVKIRGFRIELGEIEETLKALPEIRQAVVIAREDTPGDKRLVAYYTTTLDGTSGQDAIGMEQLRSHLSASLPDYMIPTAFMRLDSLPLTPNGKLDRKALPAPDANAFSVRGYEAPQGEVEEKLAEIFSDVLGINQIGRNDDFFDLGGHSLTAIRVISLIESEFNIELPVRVLFQAQSVSQIAAVIADRCPGAQRQSSQVWPTCIPIQSTGSKVPLFCVARPNVNALGYLLLSRRMGPDQPMYGLQRQLLEDPQLQFTEDQIRETAEDYIRAMQAVQPHGPYLLIGQCQGGYIAFEITRQLERQGERVAMLGMLDVWPEENTRYRSMFFAHQYAHSLLTWFRRRARNGTIAGTTPQQNRNGAAIALAHGAGTGNPLWRIYWPGRDFKPEVVSAPIVVFRGSEQPLYRIRDKEMGWGKRTTGPVEVVAISGDHFTMLREPNVQTLADRLTIYMERASISLESNRLLEQSRYELAAMRE